MVRRQAVTSNWLMYPGGQQHKRATEVGLVLAWPESESESTRAGSPVVSDNFDARTSEASSLDLDSQPSQDEFCTGYPVKRTFIHFEDSPPPSLTKCSSAPALLCRKAFQRKRNPEMEEAHRRGVCHPCAYFTHKEDGCRRGSECSFCHLCPAETVKMKKKEKMKAMRTEFASQRRRNKTGSTTSSWRGRRHGGSLY
mmetsp:Transcript_91418/g.151442  ORF Transcript_91418/g.151442 Transcript_91418/m.151442 type:complete len:197 (+) Transcript_91418:24-614(+)